MKYFAKKEFKGTLKSLGIGKGDRIIVHSYCAILGRINDIRDVIEALLETIDYDGIIVMPTYSYDVYTRDRYFNLHETRAKTGILPNAFMRYQGVRRTIQPNHSVAVWGDDRSLVVRDRVLSSYSADSTVYMTAMNNFKNIMIGTEYNQGVSFFHCIEQELQVPYRHDMDFPGVVQIGTEKEDSVYSIYVRYKEYRNDFLKVAPLLDSAPFVRISNIGYGQIKVFSSLEAYSLVRKKVQENPYYLTTAGKKL